MKAHAHLTDRFVESWAVCSVLFLSCSALAGPPSEVLLPDSTKGYVSVAQPAEFEDRWRQTQFGQMLDDEVMQPFVEDLREQIQDKYRVLEDKLGLSWDDLEGVPAGEMSLSIIERPGDLASLAITMDVAGHEQQADALLAAVEKRFAGRNGKAETIDSGGTTLHVFTVPTDPGSPPQVTVYFIKDDLLCGVDDRGLADSIVRRFEGHHDDNLASVAAYQAVMERSRRASQGLEPEARWFVEPFGFIFAVRTLEESKPGRDELDYAKIFQEQGFDAVRGVGGFVNQLVEGDVEILHRTAIYAPPVDENDPLRWARSMRMMQMPNVAAFQPQSWVPRMLASYTTISMRLIDAFDNVGPLVDAIQEHENAWQNTLDGWKNDPYGPQVDVREAFVKNLGNRITIIADYATPITTDSERAIFAVEAKDEKKVSEALEKWMSREPDVVRRQFGEFVIWERVPRDHALEEPEVEVPGFAPVQTTPADDDQPAEDERERVLPNSAITVALGQLMMASDIDYLQAILEGFAQRERLASAMDYHQVMATLDKLAPGERSALHFGRSDEEMRPTFELVRDGKMPESKTMFGKFLNNLLTTEEQRDKGNLREQRIDGSKLPSFEAVRRYFGPHGRVTHSEKDGWLITGVVLNKEAP